MFDQQTVEQVGAADPEVRQRMMVQRHPTAEPAVDIMTVAEPVQRPPAANAIARGVQPKRQQQPGRWRRMTRPVLPRLDPIFQFAQVEPFDISPDHPHRMILPDQAIDRPLAIRPDRAPALAAEVRPVAPLRPAVPTAPAIRQKVCRQPSFSPADQSAQRITFARRAVQKIHSLVGWAKRSVPTISHDDAKVVGTAQERLCPPYETECAATAPPGDPRNSRWSCGTPPPCSTRASPRNWRCLRRRTGPS